LESPSSPGIFFDNLQPQLGIDFQIEAKSYKKDLYEVVLKLTLEAKAKDTVAFIVELEQAGLFGIEGAEEKQLEAILHTFCPTQLFPYARQSIDSALAMAGLPAVNLAPINFDSLYAQNQESDKKQ
jgi:preprotein translocase subunit SecB